MTDPQPRCHVCGRTLDREWTRAHDVEYASVPETFRYFLCEACDALSIHPLPVGRLDEIYPSTYYSFAGAGGPEPGRSPVMAVKAALDRRQFARVSALAGEPAPRLLDVGGGTGDVAARLVQASGGRASATVVDIDPASIDVARARGLRGAVARFEDFETDERFDIVLMLNLVEHVANPIEVLVKARSLLAPGGVVWIQTPNFRALDARLFRDRCWTGLHCPRHWVVFSTAGLASALGKAGLAARSMEHTQSGSFWASSVLGMRRSRRTPEPGSRPLVRNPLFLPLAAAGAGFDFATRRVRATSQVVAIAASS